jgi:ribosomal protein S18 acetylase RimI-like enzyme
VVSVKAKMELGSSVLCFYSLHHREHTMPATPSHSASLRRATNEDALGILDCLQAAFEPHRDSYSQNAYLDTVLTPNTLEDRLARMHVFVAETPAGKIIGTIACHAMNHGEGHLRGMAVLPSCQGTGIAAQLLQHAEAELRRQKCTHITLDTTAPLERAMRFYEKFGYRRSGKITDFFGMPLFEFRKSVRSEETCCGFSS